jgi:hypothetical protein
LLRNKKSFRKTGSFFLLQEVRIGKWREENPKGGLENVPGGHFDDERSEKPREVDVEF